MGVASVDVERRDYFRADVSLPVAYWRETEPMPTGLSPMQVNISGSGLRLAMARPMAIGEAVSLRIGLPGAVVPARAEVVRVDNRTEAMPQVSMRFTAIGSQDQERLVQYIFSA